MSDTYTFDAKDLKEIEKIIDKYPEKQAAVLPVLWYAQDKFGHTDPSIQKLVARTMDIPEAHIHGVVTFYTQFYEKPKGKHVLDVCTCLSCQVCGGYDILHYLEEKLGIKAGETTSDGQFSLQSVECLGACGYAPMLQVTNDKYVNFLTREKVDQLVEDLKAGKKPAFESITMPQHKNDSE
ncbi:complex I 24 kDa subunit family protein [Natronogracilivirga saccharolytica]|uniref:NAD(P)H-dependent oxidoreductase subunit E n=1 Tax=Natronogracilivirga saccharolytica TaxID=2812953 RepID=A0A8J7UTB7_9BACT|nr:NAD(P)H-dependent oxidoreductase subunit E [Natronogracilivirga saccharolytica]MBP3192441.1 NAD(P)H-dependent oxidoreductase subunit E [Natronogracilivirga saccharolytica]